MSQTIERKYEVMELSEIGKSLQMKVYADTNKTLNLPRLSKITVNGLFSKFNYQIPLNSDERITILTAPNGYGKSTILRLIFNCITCSMDFLSSTMFTTIRLDFDNDKFVENVRSVHPVANRITIKYLEGSSDQISGSGLFSCRLFNGPDAWLKVADTIEASSPHYEHLMADCFIDNRTGTSITQEQIAEQYLADNCHDDLMYGETKFIYELRQQSVLFIEANRLPLALERDRQSDDGVSTSPVRAISRLVLEHVNFALSEYAQFSELIDKGFTAQVLDAVSHEHDVMSMTNHPDVEVLIRLQAEVAHFEQKLAQLGLFSGHNFVHHNDIHSSDTVANKVLYIHYNNVLSKHLKLKDVASRLELFLDFLNEQFSFKHINFSLSDGLRIKLDNDVTLELDSLSSGEQHLLVLYGRLLFGESHNLVLLDEPEISLHLEWQLNFLKHVEKIAALRSFDVIIATHSPILINGRDELMVELSEMVP